MNLPAKRTAQLAWKAWRDLNGLFAVYKPSGLTPKMVKQMIQTAIIKDLNNLEQRPQKSLVKVVQDVARLDENPNALTAVRVPSYADHPLVREPLYSNVKVAVVSEGLDQKMSGVVVLAVKHGTKDIDTYRTSRMPRTYTVKGRFGIATDTHDTEGKIWQKSTFHHVTREKLTRVISNLQRTHQKVMYTTAGVDLQSQEAYELASRGLMQPLADQVPPLVLSMRCVDFEPPEFELEIESVKESAQYLRKVIHDLAQDMKTCAVATHVRRIQDGPFSLEHALLRKHWTLPYILEALRMCRPLVKEWTTELRTKMEEVLEQTG